MGTFAKYLREIQMLDIIRHCAASLKNKGETHPISSLFTFIAAILSIFVLWQFLHPGNVMYQKIDLGFAVAFSIFVAITNWASKNQNVIILAFGHAVFYICALNDNWPHFREAALMFLKMESIIVLVAGLVLALFGFFYLDSEEGR